MQRAIILHGMPSKQNYYDDTKGNQSNAHWLPWLQRQLCIRDVLTQTPEMPRPYLPQFEAWSAEFERHLPDEKVLAVGHSCGAGFLLRWLSEDPSRRLGKVVLVAPWLDLEKEHTPMFDFELRADIANQTRRGIEVLYSTNDKLPMQTTLKYLQKNTQDITYHEFIDYGHFCARDMKTVEFPELLAICLR